MYRSTLKALYHISSTMVSCVRVRERRTWWVHVPIKCWWVFQPIAHTYCIPTNIIFRWKHQFIYLNKYSGVSELLHIAMNRIECKWWKLVFHEFLNQELRHRHFFSPALLHCSLFFYHLTDETKRNVTKRFGFQSHRVSALHIQSKQMPFLVLCIKNNGAKCKKSLQNMFYAP